MRKTNKYHFLLPERNIENGRDDAADINDLTFNWENTDSILNAQQEKDEQIEKDLKSHRDNVLLDHPDGSVTDAKIGSRKIGLVSGSLQALFNAVENVIKKINGKTAWNEAPAINLEETKKHVDNKANPHSVTKEQAGLGNVDNIQQAAKVDFDKHNTDEIRHIKNEERALWNDNIENAGKHIANADIHVALEDKENWNKTEADFSSHSSDFDLHTNTAEKEKWNTVLQKADKSNVIEKDNIASFLPTGPYQPATKKYVDDKVFDSGSGDMKKDEFAANGVFGKVDLAENASTSDVANKLKNAKTINGKGFNGTADITFGTLYPTQIYANTDLNNFTQPGMYYCPLDTTVATLGNCPTSRAFSLMVEKHAGTRQTLTEYMADSHKIYARNSYNNVWGAWCQIYTSINAQPFVSGNAGTATKLAIARTIKTNLASAGTANFDGTANITPGVQGLLPLGNGGTGRNNGISAANVLAGQFPGWVFTPYANKNDWNVIRNMALLDAGSNTVTTYRLTCTRL